MNALWPRIILSFSIAGMQLSWFYVILVLLLRDYIDETHLISAYFVVYFISFTFNKMIKSYVNAISIKCLINIIGWILGTLALVKISLYGNMFWFNSDWFLSFLTGILGFDHTFKPIFYIFLCSSIIWYLGFRLAMAHIDFVFCVKEFQFGFSILLIAFFIEFIVTAVNISFAPVALEFFFFALMAMSLAHAREGKGWLAGNDSLQWFGLVLISTAFVIFAGVLVGMIINPEIMTAVYKIWMYVWQFILQILGFIFGLLPDAEPLTAPIVDIPIPDMKESYQHRPPTMLTARRIVGYIITAFWITLFLLAIKTLSSQIIQWLQKKMNSIDGVEVEPMHGAFWADMMRLMRYIFNKFNTIYNHIINRLRVLLGMGRDKTESFSIRLIYASIIKKASAEGFIRRISQTPYDYLAELIKWRPYLQDEISFITRQYVSVRYSRCTPNKHVINRVRENWLRIKRSRLKKTGKNGA
ncbi:MAG: DUF4129 domain-containing protein [Desulfobacterales bacterium]|nr:DUF4129 domain-containing protein [Desulfobacterales bacterium]